MVQDRAMSRASRLLRLMQELRRLRPPVTASRLAEAMEVSERTIYRDIETLRGSGARIDGAAGYGYRLTEDPALPPMQFTDDEIEALVLGLREVFEIGDPALAAAADNALAKLQAVLPERLAKRFDHAVLTAKRFAPRLAPGIDPALLRRAAWEERAVDIHYQDRDGKATERRVWPLSIIYMDATNMLLAFCRLRGDFRSFRLDRVQSAALTDESFRPRRVGLLREYLEQLRSWQEG
jgi:predicted DNA-binding transcriptional regulator YafY